MSDKISVRRYTYKLENGSPNEVEAVLLAYGSCGWKTVEVVLPEEGFPTHIIFEWDKEGIPFYPMVNFS